VGWSLWLLATLVLKFVQTENRLVSLNTVLIELIDVGVLGAGVTLSILLIKRYARWIAVFLALVSAYAFWRFYIGAILFKMRPDLGALSFSGALIDAWTQASRNWLVLVATVPFAPFVIFSAIGWTVCAAFCPTEKPIKP
jgi:hypothetical protein